MTTALTSDHSADAATMVAAMRTAATAAAGLLPADIALTTGEPVTDPERTPLPAGAGTAVAARLAGEVSGDMVLVLSEEIVTALTNSPSARWTSPPPSAPPWTPRPPRSAGSG